MKRALVAWALFVFVLCMPAAVFARVGVGVGTGRIEISEDIRSGSIYTLPPITVFNTGDETATYQMLVTLNETQDELKPNPDWFSFEPSSFVLEPGGAQSVTPTFHPPIRTQPGNYFAYLEARPSETVEQGTAVVGVAAATKLSFRVVPSSLFDGIYYRLKALYEQYRPLSTILTYAVPAAILLLILNRFVNLRAALRGAWKAGRTRESIEKPAKAPSGTKVKTVKIRVKDKSD